MLYAAGGVVLLVVLLVVGRAFVSANPATIVRLLVWLGIFALIAVVLLMIESGRLFPLVFALGFPFLPRVRSWWRRKMSSSPGTARGQVSEVETEYLRMSLEHDTGTMTGTVRKGRFQGRRLEELDLAALIALWREVRAEDTASVALMESYLDHFKQDWREQAAGADGGAGGGASPTSSGAMTRDEAYAVLGLKSGASPAEIKEAHRNLMMKIHPDHGGSGVLAAQVNRAKDVLLGH